MLGSTRGSWSQENLVNAMAAVKNHSLGINEASKMYKIPKSTLKTKLRNNNNKKVPLGRRTVLSSENELEIVNHITKLQACGFTPNRKVVRSIAFKMAEKLKIDHTFNKDNEMASYEWVKSFLRRNKQLSIGKYEGISKNRYCCMSKTVKDYSDLLEKTLVDNNLNTKPGHIFNMDESWLQLNYNPVDVIAVPGYKCVSTVTSGRKGEISVVTCCNGEGNFIPPYCIFKGKNKKVEFTVGMPPGSAVVMSQNDAYMTSELFFDWLKNQFLPRKPKGKVVLILDGSSSHCSSVGMLEYADNNDVILLGLPGHAIHFLQPHRSFFKSLRSNYDSACIRFIKNNPLRKISRLQFGKILGEAWKKSATVDNAFKAPAFKACCISLSSMPNCTFLTPQQESTCIIAGNKAQHDGSNIDQVHRPTEFPETPVSSESQ